MKNTYYFTDSRVLPFNLIDTWNYNKVNKYQGYKWDKILIMN